MRLPKCKVRLPRPRLQVDTVCEVTGNYAEMGTTNWPAQLVLCPPGGASACQTTNYDPVLPVMYPYAVNSTGGKYRGEAPPKPAP